MAVQSPPQAPPIFAYSAENLISRSQQLIAGNKALVDRVVQNVSVENAEFSNVLLPLQQGKDAMTLELYPIGFLRSVSTDQDIRSAATLAEKQFSDYRVESSMREDVFKLVDAIYNKQKNDPTLDAESRYLLEKEYKSSIRMGLALPPQERDRLGEIHKRLPELYLAFGTNLRDEDGGIWLTPEQLDGVPADRIETFKKGEEGSENEGKLWLPFRYPNTMPIRKQCKVAETRKKVFVGVENRCNQNLELLKEAVAIRHEAARLLGYPDHATLALEDKMAKTPQVVENFLDDLRVRLASGAQKELDILKELKHADVGNSDGYYLWDHPYYNELMLSRDFQLDQNQIAEYFPLQACLENMLKIFEELFGLVFVKIEGKDRDIISDTGRGDDIIWHPEVELFSVWDELENGSSFIGYVYFDLLPRDGKYRGASNFTLQPGFSTKDGGRHYPATALVCNFSRPTAHKPSLLTHHDVKTMFHELGHGIHNLVAETKYGSFHGTYTTRDFVETPSKMLEHWCWTPSQIKAMSIHWSYLSSDYKKAYLDSTPGATEPDEKMPEPMIQSIITTRRINDALSNLDSLRFALFDLEIHRPKSHADALNMDVSKLYNKIRHDVAMLDDMVDTVEYNGAALMSHVMSGYDSVVYTYLWSEVYAADMFRTAFSKDPMDRDTGRRYRNIVLKPGGSRDPMELLKEFLGREPSTEAFYKDLGIA